MDSLYRETFTKAYESARVRATQERTYNEISNKTMKNGIAISIHQYSTDIS